MQLFCILSTSYPILTRLWTLLKLSKGDDFHHRKSWFLTFLIRQTSDNNIRQGVRDHSFIYLYRNYIACYNISIDIQITLCSTPFFPVSILEKCSQLITCIIWSLFYYNFTTYFCVLRSFVCWYKVKHIVDRSSTWRLFSHFMNNHFADYKTVSL